MAFSRIFLTFGTAIASASPAFAHHPMDGEVPSTLVNGLLSGIGHPIIGLDHLAFVVAVGLAAALVGRPFTLPLAFVATTVLGTLAHVAGVGLPFVEVGIAVSVLLLGVMLLSGREFGLAIYASLFAVAGIFHGHAYGEAVFGAEATPIVAYLLGFGLTQFAIAACAAIAASAFGSVALRARLTGGVVAGMGALLVSEHVLAALGLA